MNIMTVEEPKKDLLKLEEPSKKKMGHYRWLILNSFLIECSILNSFSESVPSNL
jgi:hypothetical protein